MALIFGSSLVIASGLEVKGAPEETITPLGTYGMAVNPKVGFKAILPRDFKVYIHQKAKLPNSLDWSVEDTWVTALERFTRNRDIAILVDWPNKSVMVRTPDVAVEENATRQEIAQAAKTPLPRLAPEKVSPAKEALESPPLNEASAAVVAEGGLMVDEGASRQEPQTVLSPASSAQQTQVAAIPSLAVTSPATKSRELRPTTEEVVAIAAVLAEAPEKAHASTSVESSGVTSSAVLASMAARPAPVVSSLDKTVEAPVAIAAAEKPFADLVVAAAPQILPMVRTNPTPEMVAVADTEEARKSPVLVSNEGFHYTAAIAYNKPSVRKVIDAIGRKYGLRIVWAVSQPVVLKGPVTLLANSLEQDLLLLQKAMGRGNALQFEASQADGVLRVFNPGASAAVLALAEQESAEHRGAVTASMGGIGSGAPGPLASEPSASPNLKLVVYINQPLEDALTRFAREQGYTLDWQVEGGFDAVREHLYEAEDLKRVLLKVLPVNGLSADIYTREKHIIIRPGDTRN